MGVQKLNKSNVEGLDCDACDRSFGSPRGLKLHINKKHGKQNGDKSINEGLKTKIEPKLEELIEIKKEPTPENSKRGTPQDVDKSINENQPKLPGKEAKIDNNPTPSPRYTTKISFKCKYCHSIFGNSDDMIKHHLSNHMTEARL